MKVIVTTGGSGGHIYPALSIMKRLEKAGHEVIFIGREKGMEKDIIPKRYKYEEIDVRGLKGLSVSSFKSIILFFKETSRMKKYLREEKPDLVIGFGSYVSAPVIKAATKLKLKTIIHEQNAVMGKTNRLFARKVSKVLLGMKGENGIYVGNPRSQEMYELYKKELHIGKNIFIFAGSQGSEVFNKFVIDNQENLEQLNCKVHFATGRKHYKYVNNNLRKNTKIKIYEYISDMQMFLRDKDLCITRAGASTIAELSAIKMPMILIPSPYVTNDHQNHNAMSLEKEGAAVLIREKYIDKLIENIEFLINKDSIKMKENLNNLRKINSIDLFITQINELMEE